MTLLFYGHFLRHTLLYVERQKYETIKLPQNKHVTQYVLLTSAQKKILC